MSSCTFYSTSDKDLLLFQRACVTYISVRISVPQPIPLHACLKNSFRGRPFWHVRQDHLHLCLSFRASLIYINP